MYTVGETIIVEGVYDKIKLSGFIDSLIFTTGGFSVFNNKKTQESIKTFAQKTGIVILTDSDSAGLKIRNFVKQLVPPEQVKHAYVPEIYGKERRKTVCSKEGFLGVEGIRPEIIIKAIEESGATVNGTAAVAKSTQEITKADFFSLGLAGGNESAILRQRLATELGLPSKISSNMLLSVVNRLLTPNELSNLVETLRNM